LDEAIESHALELGVDVELHDSSASSNNRSAAAAAISRMRSRPKSGNFDLFDVVPGGPATANHTRPTGLSALPPDGPATPVVDTAQSAPNFLRAPSAIARAVSSETAPTESSTDCGTSRNATFAEFA